MYVEIQDNDGVIWCYKNAEIEVYTDYIFVYTDSHVHWEKQFKTSQVQQILIDKNGDIAL